MNGQELNPIGFVRSPYQQKFAIPRQPNLVTAAVATLELFADYADINCLRGIEQFSHLWLVFLFHATAAQGWSPTVQPPRLGGKERVGVFASRSPFRPNPIGISAVEYLGHENSDGVTKISIKGVDLLDGTPVLDIKPYIAYADAIPSAHSGYADEKPSSNFEVVFTDPVKMQLSELEASYPELRELIIQILTQDPRPAWRVKDNDGKQYGMALYEFNIKWRIQDNQISVSTITRQ